MRRTCDFCGKTADRLGPCGSPSHQALMGCAAKDVCRDCGAIHQALFLLIRGLIQSKRAERSDSVRVMLFSAVHNALVECKSELSKIDSTLYRYLMRTLETTSAFSENEETFQAAIRTIARSLPALPELVRSIVNHGETRNFERILSQAAEISEERAANNRWAEQAAHFLMRATRPTLRARLENELRAARRRRLHSCAR